MIVGSAMDIQAEFSKTRGLRVRLARELGITQGAISQWSRVPAERVLDVSRIADIPKEELRPDLYPPGAS